MRDFDLEFKTDLELKRGPDFVEIKHKAKAGISEKDLIERNTIGNVKSEEEEDDDTRESKQR